MAEETTITIDKSEKENTLFSADTKLSGDPIEPRITDGKKKKYLTLEDALRINDQNTWNHFWEQCRIIACHHVWPIPVNQPVEADNKIRLKFFIDWTKIEEEKPEDVVDIKILRYDATKDSELFRSLQETFPELTDEIIEGYTYDHHEAMFKKERDFEEYLEYKENGNLRVETVDDTKPISWESIRNATTEELFQTKLEIFESPPVQESNKKDLRSKIRKAESIIEAMYYYYVIVNDLDQNETTGLPEHIDDFITEIPSEQIFKYKLQIFEKEDVQESDNKEARSKIRKAETLSEIFSAYNEIREESTKE